jgi:hypothetical protein
MNMEDEKWKTQYEQLNQRARWYSTQLWVVPFTYLGLVGIGFEKISALKDTCSKSTGFLLMAFFSLAIFVHVSSVKYYERKAVKAIKDMEPSAISSGGSPWYLNYAFFIKTLLCFLSFFFTINGVWPLVDDPKIRIGLLVLSLVILAVVYLLVIIRDYCRNKSLLEQIKEAPK